MNEFKYTSRPYVSRVNLETLGKSFDTLEQGHKEAVKTASDLKTAIYNLQMDNSENGFKDQLISEIQKTIDDNTVYGNQYAALDDIIAKSGDIATDGRVSGRLKSYAAKKEFDNRLDKMNITEDMKTMYKELNPYEYTDGKFNETTNKYEEGKIWEAKDTPVDTVPISTIQQLALQIASKKEGGGNTVYFMDANGNYTTDAKKSVDGQIYKTVDTKYTILSKEKIAEAYKLAIDSIPGAEESLKQDYKLDTWKYDKAVTEEDPAPVIKGITDKNGYKLSYDNWLNAKITDFAKIAEVHNVDSKTTYHNVSSISSGRGGQGGGGRGLIGIHAQGNNGNNTPYVASAWTIEEYDPYGEYNQYRSSSIDTIRNYFKKYYPKAAISTADDQQVINFMKKYYDPNKTSEANVKKIFGAEALRDKKLAAQLGDVLNTYHNADVTINNIRSKMSNEDRELLDFSEQARTGNYTPNNPYSKQIISNLNSITEPVVYEIGADVMKYLIKQYGFRNEKDFTSLGFKVSTSGDNFKITIPTNVKNQIPKFQSSIDKADNAAGGNIWTAFKHKFGIVSGANYKIIGEDNLGIFVPAGVENRNAYKTVYDTLGNLYDKVNEKSNNVKDKAGIRTLTRTIEAMPYGSAESLYIETSGAYAGLSTNEKIKLQEKADEHLVNLFKTADLRTAMIYKEDSGIYQPVSNNNTIQKDINNAASKGWLSINIAQKPNVGHGYTYFVNYKTKETDDYKTVMITNTTIEDDGFYTPQSDPAWRVKNDMQIQNGTGMPIHNLGVQFGSLGDTRIHTDVHNQKYIDLDDKNLVLSEQDAVSLSIVYNELGNIKDKIYYMGNNASAINYYEQQINAIAVAIATITKTNLKDVQSNIETYLSE